jgi:hypothetical protein
MSNTGSLLFSRFAGVALCLLLLAACRPDQVEHLKDSKRIGIETANWEVKRIMPADLLRATRWAGDSLTATADTLLRRTLARELAAGGGPGRRLLPTRHVSAGRFAGPGAAGHGQSPRRASRTGRYDAAD